MRVVFFIFLFLDSILLFAQNLVDNNSFENYSNCPNQFNQLTYCEDWTTPNYIYSTPDYFNTCAPIGSNVAIPENIMGFQYPSKGEAYIGIIVFDKSWTINDAREYVSSKLLQKMDSGQVYHYSMYVNLAEVSKRAIATIGAYFSSSLNIPVQGYMLIANPQVENLSSLPLTDYDNWIQVSGSFVAQGDEEYITIGNFKDDNHSGAVVAGKGTEAVAYYYIDDVCVSLNPTDCGIDTTKTGISNINSPQLNFRIFPNPAKDNLNMVYLSGDNENLSITVTNMLGQDVLNNKPLSVYGADILNISTLSNGIYFLKILQNGQHLETKKFVIEK